MSEYTLPLLPPPCDLETVRVLKHLATASRALAELKGYADTLPNKNILINAVLINEAKDSSAIENIITTHDEIYQKMVKSNYDSPAAKEIMRYRTAVWRGFELVKDKQLLTTNMIIQIQSLIEENIAGIRKLPGTVLKNDATGEVIYAPPVGENVLLDYMINLENYINNHGIHPIDPLIKLAIIHYQFESIHPFYDGNGRTGRIINILYLVLCGLLDSPILYLSRYIVRKKQDYYHHLQNIRETGDWEGFIIYMLVGIEETSAATLTMITGINSLFEKTATKVKQELPKLYSKELLELLFFEFYTKTNYMVDGLRITRKTAASYLSALEGIGILESEKIGKERIYKNAELFNLIKKKGL
jgi:Fic family protein